MNLWGESRYTIIVASARRARQILAGAPPVIEGESSKPVTIALEELNAGKIHWIRTKDGIK